MNHLLCKVVRRRELFGVAIVWSLSNGALSRISAVVRWVLLPVAGPIHLIGACVLRRHLVTCGRAAIVVRAPGQANYDALSFILIGIPSLVLAWGAILSLPYVAPSGFFPYALVANTLWLVAGLADVLIDSLRLVLRSVVRGRPTRADAGPRPSGRMVYLSSLAAYPRGMGAGSRLMAQVTAALDASNSSAELRAGTDELQAWYHRLGFESTTSVVMRREPRNNCAKLDLAP